jgi:hypothetical protein
LQYIFDCQAAVRTLSRLLKPGGVVLATMPGLSQVGLEEWSAQRRWAFTDRSVRDLFEAAFPAEFVDVTTYGNVLTAAAFLYGLAVPDLRPSELTPASPQYQLVIAVRAMKPAG